MRAAWRVAGVALLAFGCGGAGFESATAPPPRPATYTGPCAAVAESGRSACIRMMAEQQAARDATETRRQRLTAATMASVRARQEAAETAGREEAERRAAVEAARAQTAHDEGELQSIDQRLKASYAGGSAWAQGAADIDLTMAVGQARTDLARAGELRAALKKEPVPQEKVDAILGELGAVVAAEQKCRADAKCMGERAARRAEAQFFGDVVSPMCQADQQREDAIAGMARERSNPSGYVNKSVLYDFGERQLSAEEQLRALAPAYAKVRHHGWPGWRRECKAP